MNTAVVAHNPTQQAPAPAKLDPSRSLVARVAARFHVDPEKMMSTLKSTAFRQGKDDPEPTNEQMMALLVVADQYGLNPWTREIYAFPDKQRGIVPIVGLDGWSRIVNQHEKYDGVEFEHGPASSKHKGAPEWIDCVIWRKDRTHPTRVREVLDECWRDTGPWKSHPSRMLRHKAFMQAGRLAFAFVGIYDEDEAMRIIEGEAARAANESAPAIDAINAAVSGKASAPAALEHNPGQSVPQTIEGEATTVPKEPEQTTSDAPAPRTGSEAPTVETFADVAKAIDKAGNADALDLAADRIRALASEGDRIELQSRVNKKRASWTKS